MVDAGILGEDDRVELLDGVLVEMSPQGPTHLAAVTRLNMLVVPVAAAAGLVVTPQCPLDVLSPISQLVIEVSVTSRAIDLGRKATIYATAGIPEYWVLDLDHRRLVVHREPAADHYETVDALTDDDTVTATGLPLTVAVADLLPPRR
jgi:Uma2 family endonuclease